MIKANYNLISSFALKYNVYEYIIALKKIYAFTDLIRLLLNQKFKFVKSLFIIHT